MEDDEEAIDDCPEYTSRLVRNGATSETNINYERKDMDMSELTYSI